MSNISKRTNIFLDGEVAGYVPDQDGDYFMITDYGRDFNYDQEKIAYAVRALMGQADKSFIILYGGEVTDSGSGQVDISEGLAIGQDSDGNCRFVPIPALTNIPMPAGWNDGRQIWVVGEHLFKISTDTRAHKQTTTSYHYTVVDSYLGEASSDDLFVDADPGATTVIWDSFTMTGTTFASLRGAERSTGNLKLNGKLEIGYNSSGSAIIMNIQNTDLVIGTNNTDRGRFTAGGGLAIGTTAVKGTAGKVHILYGTANADTNWNTYSPLVVESGSAVAINLRTPNNANSRIIFSDPDADLSGALGYVHTGDYMFFTTEGSVRMRLNATGLYVGGSADPSNPLHVQSTTTPQVRIAYDASNYATLNVSSGNNLTITSGAALLLVGSTIQVRGGISQYFYSNDNLEYGLISHNGTNLIIGTGGTNAGNIVITNTTECTGADTGALQVDGGADFAKHVNMQTNLTVGTGIIATTGDIEATAGYLKGPGFANLLTWNASVTEASVYSALSGYFPIQDVYYKVTGGISVSNVVYPVTRAKRTSTAVIVYRLDIVAQEQAVSFTSGSGSIVTTWGNCCI